MHVFRDRVFMRYCVALRVSAIWLWSMKAINNSQMIWWTAEESVTQTFLFAALFVCVCACFWIRVFSLLFYRLHPHNSETLQLLCFLSTEGSHSGFLHLQLEEWLPGDLRLQLLVIHLLRDNVFWRNNNAKQEKMWWIWVKLHSRRSHLTNWV